MLLNGVNHVAILTNNTARLHAFYREVFDATISRDTQEAEGMRLSFIDIGPTTALNVFEIDGNDEAARQTPMFGRGHIDHLGQQAASNEGSNDFRSQANRSFNNLKLVLEAAGSRVEGVRQQEPREGCRSGRAQCR